MIVYVVMGGDFPAGVFSTKEQAEGYITMREAADEKNGVATYWRTYTFVLDDNDLTT